MNFDFYLDFDFYLNHWIVFVVLVGVGVVFAGVAIGVVNHLFFCLKL